jgi:hypothetical protein
MKWTNLVNLAQGIPASAEIRPWEMTHSKNKFNWPANGENQAKYPTNQWREETKSIWSSKSRHLSRCDHEKRHGTKTSLGQRQKKHTLLSTEQIVLARLRGEQQAQQVASEACLERISAWIGIKTTALDQNIQPSQASEKGVFEPHPNEMKIILRNQRKIRPALRHRFEDEYFGFVLYAVRKASQGKRSWGSPWRGKILGVAHLEVICWVTTTTAVTLRATRFRATAIT